MSMWLITKAVYETAKISVPTIYDSVRGKLDTKASDRRVTSWSQRLFDQADMKMTLHGRKHLETDETFVVMSNHQSLYDIPAIILAFEGRSIRMITKKELFRFPVWGAAMKASGFVAVDRSNREAAIASLKEAERALASGIDIWIAPEGTRSRTGVMASFKQGGFHMAVDTGTRILPVTITGTRDALVADRSAIATGAEVNVTISPPVDPADFGQDGRHALVMKVREQIAQYLPEELRGEQELAKS
jgi:1-acyl-sn-glycerol-3-phosphate acyltransferase